MPTNRVRIKRAARSHVTDEAVALFRLCEEIIATGQDETFEDKGGRRSEYLDTRTALHSALGVKPWERSPLDTDSEAPPDYMRHNPLQSGYWRKAWAMRCEILATMKQGG